MAETCKVEGCEREHSAHGYCNMHACRWRLSGDPGEPEPRHNRVRRGIIRTCAVEGCENPYRAKGYCTKHYHRWTKYGDTSMDKPPSREPVPTGKYTREDGYVVCYFPEHPNSRVGGMIFEHTIIMTELLGRPLRSHESVHHKNGIKDDNRPKNLELWASKHAHGQRVSDLQEFATEIAFEYGLVGELPY